MNEYQLNFDDIYDIWPSLWWENFLLLLTILGVCLAVILLFVGVYYYKNRSIIIDAREQALKRLYALNPHYYSDVNQGMSQSQYKYFYTELLAIIKEYLELKYNFKAYEKTDNELLLGLKKSENVAIFYHVARQIVERGLMVRFARYDGKYDYINEDYLLVLEVLSCDAKKNV